MCMKTVLQMNIIDDLTCKFDTIQTSNDLTMCVNMKCLMKHHKNSLVY